MARGASESRHRGDIDHCYSRALRLFHNRGVVIGLPVAMETGIVVSQPLPKSLLHRFQRLVLWIAAQLFIALPLNYFLLLRGWAAAERADFTGPTWSSTLVSLFALATIPVCFVALAAHAFRTARALRSSFAWIWAVAMVPPLVNIVTLLLLARASHRFRDETP